MKKNNNLFQEKGKEDHQMGNICCFCFTSEGKTSTVSPLKPSLKDRYNKTEITRVYGSPLSNLYFETRVEVLEGEFTTRVTTPQAKRNPI